MSDVLPPKAGARALRFGGLTFVGIVRLPARKPGAKLPAVLFLHGFPGSEHNHDIQRALQDAGVVTFNFHARGAWGSEGTYRFSKLVPDAKAALRWVRSRAEVDAKRVAVVGYSMGGWTAINVASQVPDVRALVAIAPAGGPELLEHLGPKFLRDHSEALRVGSAQRLHSDCARAFVTYDPHKAIAKLEPPMLLIHGTEDEVVPVGISDMFAKEALGNPHYVRAEGARHDFLDRRPWLVKTVVDWLMERV